MRKRFIAWGAAWLLAGIGLAWPAGSAPPAPRAAASLESDPHLVGWWKLDQCSGKRAADASGHGRNGVLEGGLSFDARSVPGRTGRALAFDGGEGCVRVPGFKGVTGTRPRSVAVWIKPSGTTGEIVSWGQDDYGKMWILGYVRTGVGVTPRGGYLYMKPGLEDGAWHHVVAVLRGGSPPNVHDDVQLYRDGQPAEIDDIGLLDLWPIETGQQRDVRIGWRFRGAIADLRIYDRALGDEEVGALFHSK
jgi:hypothetical protein